jgi:hypothetical protein
LITPTDIRQIHGDFEVRIALLIGSGNTKLASARARGDLGQVFGEHLSRDCDLGLMPREPGSVRSIDY